MKPQKILYSAFLFFFFFSIIGTKARAEDRYEKKKIISRSFPLSSAKSFAIDNQFGNVVIKNTNGSEIKVEIEISAEANDESYAQELIDRVSIEEIGTPDIFFKTSLKKDLSSGSKRGNQKFNINYTVQLPGTLPLKLKNQFGNIDLDDYSGPTNIQCKFGNLATGNLSKAEKISVEFGKIKCGDLDGNTEVEVKYSNGSIGEINGVFKCSVDFGNLGSITLGNNAKDVYIKNNYSNTDIKVPANYSASFEIKTNFGKLINRTGFNISDNGEDEEDMPGRPTFEREYKGTCGSGTNKVRIKSNFGNVKLEKL